MPTTRLLCAALLVSLVPVSANNGTSTGLPSPSCSPAKLKKNAPVLNAQGIPVTPCSRKDVKRNHGCAAMAPVVSLAKNVTRNARLHSNRHDAVLQELRPGGRIVEVGTQQGEFARYLIRTCKPVEFRAIEIDPKMHGKCERNTKPVGLEMGTNVTCMFGNSRTKIKRLRDEAYDLVYIDADHDYSGVCQDMEAAKSKVKVGGLFVMNDYYLFESTFLFSRGRWGIYGVIHAVNEFLIRYPNFEVAYYAMHPRNEGDIGLRRVW